MNGRNIQSVSEVDDQETARLEEASLWFDQLEDGSADRDAFEAWRAVPANAVAFARTVDSANWLDNQKHRLPEDYVEKQVVQLKGRRKFVLAAAVGTGIALIGGGTFAMLNPPRAEASTGVGDRNSIALPDGGRLDINTDSQVFWRFDKNIRRIWLERGEVAVTIANDPRPLILEHGKNSIQLTAGLVNIRAVRDKTTVLIVDGSARLAGSGQTIAQGEPVGSGHVISLEAGTSKVSSVTSDEIESASAWRQDEIVFSGAELSQAVAEYNRYLTRKIVLADGKIASIKIGGRFTTRDPAEFLSALRTSFALHVTDDGKGPIEISR